MGHTWRTRPACLPMNAPRSATAMLHGLAKHAVTRLGSWPSRRFDRAPKKNWELTLTCARSMTSSLALGLYHLTFSGSAWSLGSVSAAARQLEPALRRHFDRS